MKTKTTSIHQNDPLRTSHDAPTRQTNAPESSCQCHFYQGESCATCAPKSSPLPWSTNEDGRLYSGEECITDDGLFTADADLIVRRVNQGPAFDAVVEAFQGLMVDAPKQGTPYPMPARWSKAYAALKLVQGKH